MAKPKESKGERPNSAQSNFDPHKEEYSTVDQCSTILDQRPPVTSESVSLGPATSVPEDLSRKMVECELYSEAADPLVDISRTTMPDISPYACFYGAPKHQMLKVGWLDKLSPQG